jgi:hypothetical protein
MWRHIMIAVHAVSWCCAVGYVAYTLIPVHVLYNRCASEGRSCFSLERTTLRRGLRLSAARPSTVGTTFDDFKSDFDERSYVPSRLLDVMTAACVVPAGVLNMTVHRRSRQTS